MKIKTLITSLAVLLGLVGIPTLTLAQTDVKQARQSHKTHHQKPLHASVVTHPTALMSSSGNLTSSPNSTPVAAGIAPVEQGHTQMDRLIQSYLQSLPMDWDNPGTSFVSIGPYINIPIKFSGGQLIINDPRINTDVALLKLRKAALEGMRAKGIHTGEDTHHSHLILSGFLEGEMQYIKHGQQGGNSGSGNNGSSSDINLSTAELDAFILSPSPWVSGFFSLSYNNGIDPNENNSRVLNSTVFLNNAFIMLGDFTQSPVYATLGQYYVPFGTYSSVMASSPLTKTLGRTKARALLAGYRGQRESDFYTAIYAFKGDSHASATSRINNGGINLGYHFDIPHPNFNGDVGMGYLANIADSVGMQNTGGQPQFNGFAGRVPFGNEKLVHRIPALDFRALLTLGENINLIGEYVGVTTSFNPNDLSFNGHGARPWATNGEASYTFQFFDKPSSIGIGFSQAREALAIGLPERRMSAVFNTSIWHNTVQNLEFRHDINYASSTTATGSNVSPPVQGLGTYDNVITFQFDLYF